MSCTPGYLVLVSGIYLYCSGTRRTVVTVMAKNEFEERTQDLN